MKGMPTKLCSTGYSPKKALSPINLVMDRWRGILSGHALQHIELFACFRLPGDTNILLFKIILHPHHLHRSSHLFAIILPSYSGDFNDMVTNVIKLSSELMMLVIVFFNFDNVSLLAEVVLKMRVLQNPANAIKGVKRGFQLSSVM